MAKKVKFPLDMGNEVYVRTLEELKENYDTEKVTEYFLNGRLLTWLDDRYYDEEAEQVRELAEQGDKDDLAAKLGKIFGMEIESEVDVEALEIRREKLEKLRKITADDNILDNADLAAFSQEELGDLLDEGVETIYLCGGTFRIPASVKNVRYIGVDSPVVTIGGKGEIDLEASGIVFENCEFSENMHKKFSDSSKSEEKQEYDENIFEGVFIDDSHFEFETDYENNVILKKYNGNDKVIVVPDIVNEISSNAFADLVAEAIKIPDSVGKIGNTAFMNCKNLKKIILPQNLRSLGSYIPKISGNLFYHNIHNIDNSLVGRVFQSCISLKSIKIPDGITVIERYNFSGCTSLSEVILPKELTKICESAFSGCASLEKVYIPDKVVRIERLAFENCKNLKEVRLPNGIKYIADSAFQGDTNVTFEYRGQKYIPGQHKIMYMKINNANKKARKT